MGNLWLKIKVWTKVIVVSALCLYALLFVWKNSTQSAKFWFWFFKDPYETSLLVLVVCTFLSGVIAAVLVKTSITTIRQIQDLRKRSRTERMERDLIEMKQKASRLQTKPEPSAATRVIGTPEEGE